MVNELVFDGACNFQVTGAVKIEGKVIIDVASTHSGSRCPLCNECSFRIHSYYFRTMLDLPILGNETWIRLKARKFYCRNNGCDAKVFAERFGIHFKKGKRMTEKVCEKISKVALLMVGEGGRKICGLISLPVSSSTLLRSIYAKQIPEVETPRILGLDDWAYRKFLKYGTVLVDLEKQKIIDLLPDREADTVGTVPR
jgi:transposase